VPDDAALATGQETNDRIVALVSQDIPGFLAGALLVGVRDFELAHIPCCEARPVTVVEPLAVEESTRSLVLSLAVGEKIQDFDRVHGHVLDHLLVDSVAKS
jgi:hypothetical protein